jgi:hypothetical protein
MINRKVLKEGYKLYSAKKITDLEFIVEYVFEGIHGDVIDIVPVVNLIVDNIITKNFDAEEAQTIVFNGSSHKEIKILYDYYMIIKNRDKIINDIIYEKV